MRYEFTRSQQREMFDRCKVDGVARCEYIRSTGRDFAATLSTKPMKLADLLRESERVGPIPHDARFPTEYRCNAPLKRGRFTFDHTDPTYIAAKRVTAADGQVICRECDKEKYSTIDRPKIDKTRRLADREIGARRPRRSLIPGSKGSGVRRRFNRERQRWETIRVNE